LKKISLLVKTQKLISIKSNVNREILKDSAELHQN